MSSRLTSKKKSSAKLEKKAFAESLTRRMIRHSVVAEVALVIVTARELELLLDAYKQHHNVE